MSSNGHPIVQFVPIIVQFGPDSNRRRNVQCFVQKNVGRIDERGRILSDRWPSGLRRRTANAIPFGVGGSNPSLSARADGRVVDRGRL